MMWTGQVRILTCPPHGKRWDVTSQQRAAHQTDKKELEFTVNLLIRWGWPKEEQTIG